MVIVVSNSTLGVAALAVCLLAASEESRIQIIQHIGDPVNAVGGSFKKQTVDAFIVDPSFKKC